jgi:hypothetical protein
MRLILLPIVALSTLLAAPAVAQEQPRCRALDQLDAWLASEYQEVLTSGGISDDGTLVRFYESPQRTWSVVKVTPQKLACVVDQGGEWLVRLPEPDQGTGL